MLQLGLVVISPLTGTMEEEDQGGSFRFSGLCPAIGQRLSVLLMHNGFHLFDRSGGGEDDASGKGGEYSYHHWKLTD